MRYKFRLAKKIKDFSQVVAIQESFKQVFNDMCADMAIEEMPEDVQKKIHLFILFNECCVMACLCCCLLVCFVFQVAKDPDSAN